jgi:ribonuclease BN (tRNA processing enzyme)
MELIVLGCSGSGPGPESPAAGYLVRAGGAAVTLDMGNGTFGALQRHLDPFDLDAALFSHLHPDHCADFSALVVSRRYHPRPPYDVTVRRLPVHAPAEAPERFAVAYAASAEERVATDLTDAFEFVALADGIATTVAGMRLEARRVDHLVETYALRLEHDGRSIVYSGDTGPCTSLVELARGADVLLCEATWPHSGIWGEGEPPPGVHLSGRQAGEHATKAGVGRLLLTHIASWYDRTEILAEARAAFDGPVELAEAGASYPIRRGPGAA